MVLPFLALPFYVFIYYILRIYPNDIFGIVGSCNFIHFINYIGNHVYTKKVKEGTELKLIQTNYDEEKAKHSASNWEVVIDGLKKLVE